MKFKYGPDVPSHAVQVAHLSIHSNALHGRKLVMSHLLARADSPSSLATAHMISFCGGVRLRMSCT